MSVSSSDFLIKSSAENGLEDPIMVRIGGLRLAKVAVATYIVLPSFVVAGYGFPASFAVAAYDCGGGLNRPPIPKVVAS
jgi:hypothetical protein